MKAMWTMGIVLWAAAALADPAPGDRARAEAGVAVFWGPTQGTVGLGGVAELKYYPVDWAGAGLRLDGGVRGGGRASTGSTAVQLGTIVAALAKAEVFLLSGELRPFLGAGAGLYAISGQGLSAGSGGAGASVESGRFFGLAPQLGVDFGTWRLTTTYNALFGAEVSVPEPGGESRRVSRNYLGLEVTFLAWRLPRAQ
jgi:hypothetical protein